ncbi:hypothetical protein P43SY_006719 [Pythium insidiosum]|uniref:Saccharopine dehydrogenase NADP binding domain-containing protein n=1 Tax=Pythium insidiosum TaxID=114742 RepID=A0AAD5LSQ1_PYTIN|nr:hypothetical protein P43SY_006719 [Pythium insidiosum]
MISDKPFDIVIFGASGFTGQLVTRYFLTEPETARGRLRWAVAGRDHQKLRQLLQSLKTKLPQVAPDRIDEIPIVVADGGDDAAVRRMVQSTRVVLSVAGPYAVYSARVVQHCAENGVHYCDLTAELLWVKQNMHRYEAVAKQTGARLVHCCGFESVPSDILSFLLAASARTPLSRIDYVWTETLGGASGGTYHSMLQMMDIATDEDVRRMSNPFFFTDDRYADAKHELVASNASPLGLVYDSNVQSRTAFFIGALANQMVVLRSNFLFRDVYGKRFSYVERLGLGRPLQWLMALAFTVVGWLALYRWTRALLWWVVPAPGTGPPEKLMEQGYFKAQAFAMDEAGRVVATGSATCVGDPGYLQTSKMISEVAFCLANDEHDGGLAGGGFLTPATAGAHSLARRLNDKKVISFDVRTC